MNEFITTTNLGKKEVVILDEKNIKIDGEIKKYQLMEIDKSKYLLKIENKFYTISYIQNNDEDFEVFIDNVYTSIKVRTNLQEKAQNLISKSQSNSNLQALIKSPMPGLVIKILKKSGETITKGETILILEAMKMENEIKAIKDGTIAEIMVKTGQAIEKNITLFSIK